jgi:tetratricopeptide (TPR) repeat protein
VYTSRQVAELLDLPIAQIREYARAGFVSPLRTPTGAYRFDFQDLVLLRTAVRLAKNDLSHNKVRTAFRRLREQLPPDRPLTEIDVAAVGGQVMVQDGETLWNAESGQVHLNFAVERRPTLVSPLVQHGGDGGPDDVSAPAPTGPGRAHDCYTYACEIEPTNPLEAISSYREALRLDPNHADAHINLGRLLHDAGNAKDAAVHYRAALRARPDSTTAAFNLGVALDDLDRPFEAIEAYRRSIESDPEFPDPHYNIAVLYERLGNAPSALRHLSSYKQLTERLR